MKKTLTESVTKPVEQIVLQPVPPVVTPRHFTMEEFKSIGQTFLSVMVVLLAVIDMTPDLQKVLNGDWSKPTLFAVAIAILKSVIKLSGTKPIINIAGNSQVAPLPGTTNTSTVSTATTSTDSSSPND